MKRILAIFWIGLLVTVAPARADSALALSTVHMSPYVNGDGTGFIERIAGEAFRRIDHTLEIATVPAERSLINVDSGVDDGELFRAAGMERLYPNLRMVPEHLLTFEFSAFVKNPDIKVSDWQSLKSKRLGIVRGWKILEERLANHGNLNVVNFPDDLFAGLQRGDMDVVLYGRVVGLEHARRSKLSVHVSGPPLLRAKMYLYLNARHVALVPPLKGALADMKRDGFYESTMRDFTNMISID